MADHRENVVFTMLKIKNTNEDLRDVVAQVNSDLNTAKKRCQGLLVLQQILGQCSAEMFSGNFHTWLNLLLQILQGYASPEQYQVALDIMSSMIQKVTAFPELSRDMGTNKVKTILPVLLSLTCKKTKEAVAVCISSCIMHFPGPTSFFKSKIEAMVMEELDNPFPPKEEYIRCYVLLARCEMGCHRDKQREAWQAQYEKMLSALRSVLSKLYAGLESGEEDGDDEFFVLPIPNVQPEQTTCLVRRFCTLCTCLGTLLREPFPTWVRLNPSGLLQLICRTLAVQTDMLKAKGSTDHMLLLTYLPLMYSSVFNLLTHLIVCGKMLLVANGDMLVSLCVQCLASMTVSKAGCMPYRKVRQQVYHTLQTWLQVAGTSAMTNFTSDEALKDLLAQIFSDVTPQQPEALLLGKSSQERKSKPPPRKKRRKSQPHQELSVNVHALLPAADDLVLAGLTTLTQLIKSSAVFMEEQFFKSVKDRVCSLVNEVQRNPLPPYTTSPSCGQALYAVLMESATCPRPDPCHLQYAVTLFQRGVMDTQFVVAKTCREALAVCQTLIHPRTPCLLAPVSRPARLGDALDFVDQAWSRTEASPATVNTTPAHNTAHDSNTVSTVAAPSSTALSSHKQPRMSQRTPGSSCDSEQNQPGHVKSESESDCTEDSESESFPSAGRSEGVAGPSVADSAVMEVEGVETPFSDSTEVSGVDKEELATLSAPGEEDHAGTSFAEKLPEDSLKETDMNAGMSAMLSSFVPCGADPDDDNVSDSD